MKKKHLLYTLFVLLCGFLVITPISSSYQNIDKLVELIAKLTETIEKLELRIQALEARIEVLEAERAEKAELHQVQRVVDGDTIELLNGQTARYIGIDTPETKHPAKPVEYFGKEAYEYNKKLVEGKKVRLEFDVQKIDNYERLLAYVFLEDDTFINAELVKNGYAKVSTYPPNVKYQDYFLELQREARKNNRGLWSEETDSESEQKESSKVRNDDIVYITKTGTKYHKSTCRYLNKSKTPITKSEAIKLDILHVVSASRS